jgi:ribonuclease BN (tRNA processing enzyme)
VQLTVLGSAASFAGAGQACSGYLVESDGATVMIDCGNGSVANAAAVTDVTSIDAVFVSHTHADHILDLYALQAALRFAPEGPVGSVPLYLPEGLWERMGALLPPSGRAQLADAFEPHVHEAGRPLLVGDMTLTALPVDHDGPSFGFVVETPGTRFVYTGDTRDGDAVRALARDCDVLVAECTLPAEYAGRAAHLTASEAGRLAEESGAGLLVLTHLWPTADHERMRDEASAVFDGEIVLARELMTIEIEPEA